MRNGTALKLAILGLALLGLYDRACAQEFRYFVGLGPWYSHYAEPREGGLSGLFAWRTSERGKWFAYSALDLTSTEARIRPGAAFALTETDQWTLLLIADSSIAINPLNNLAGSPALFRRYRGAWWIYGAVRIPASSLKPEFRAGIGRAF